MAPDAQLLSVSGMKNTENNKVNFGNYQAIVSFVNINNIHWKFLIRTIHHREREWADIEFTGAVMQHPVQHDTYSCGVMVMMMAKAVMEAFPKLPNMEFGTTEEEMAEERTAMALELLEASVMPFFFVCLFFKCVFVLS
ncbi:hypothetical protein G5714_022605 [Onychostoma macrolepis]|uniref:Ubiquitin-like protease family profile domain-containing protein n=1 Tax=Onychostoma macrolepis TaxID=369639 RepID=A0A7J6BNW2_9TELE|nr:hypothetical protein G5714_022605 [Onychostoma macrolepis]